MRSVAVVLLLCAHALATSALAQSTKASDEQAVRAESERWMQLRNAPRVDTTRVNTREMWIPGAVFVSGNFTHPRFVGDTTSGNKVRTRVQTEKRENEKLTRQNIRRVTVSKAGDMAWEYTDFEYEYDAAATKKHVKFDGSMLRVWQKVDGQWKIAAQFSRPNGDE